MLLILSLMSGACCLPAQTSWLRGNSGGTSQAMDSVAAGKAASDFLPLRLSGLNAGVSAAGVHDSSTGWFMILTPFASYDLSPHYSADVSMSLYPYRYTQTPTPGPSQETTLAFDGGDVGDMLLEAHAVFNPRRYRSISTALMTLPTGNRTHGLGTGRMTFNLEERVERYFGQTGLVIGVGGGDSAGLQNRLVMQDDTALGALAQFQAGVITWLPNGVSLQSVAYEQLPLGDQKKYTTLSAPGLPNISFVSGRKVNEDNGLTTTISVPLTSHLMLASSYSRSLRLHLDTASTGLTFTFRGFSVRRRESLVDRAMREAERGASSVK